MIIYAQKNAVDSTGELITIATELVKMGYTVSIKRVTVSNGKTVTAVEAKEND